MQAFTGDSVVLSTSFKPYEKDPNPLLFFNLNFTQVQT